MLFKEDKVARADAEAIRKGIGFYRWTHDLVEVTGRDALEVLQKIYISDLSKVPVGKSKYTASLDENGEIIDDVIVMHMADEIYVMYCGKIVERAKTRDLFKDPLHPYTMGLLGSIARIDDERGRFVQIPSSLPSPINKPSGCYFHPRCQYATEKCKEQMPPLETPENGRCVRCWNYKEIKDGKRG